MERTGPVIRFERKSNGFALSLLKSGQRGFLHALGPYVLAAVFDTAGESLCCMRPGRGNLVFSRRQQLVEQCNGDKNTTTSNGKPSEHGMEDKNGADKQRRPGQVEDGKGNR